MPPHCVSCTLHCPGPGVWPQPGRQELVPAVCHLSSPEPSHALGLGLCCALFGNSVSFSPSLPSPDPMHPLPWSVPVFLHCLAEPCLAWGCCWHNRFSYFLRAHPRWGLCPLGWQRAHGLWSQKTCALVQGLLLSSCSTLVKSTLSLSPHAP